MKKNKKDAPKKIEFNFEKSQNYGAEVSDVTGAGDTVISSFCVNYLRTKNKVSSFIR